MKKIVILIFALVIMTACPGCQKIKKVFIKPPPEGLIERSYSIRLLGYQQTVSIRSTSKELSGFLNNPEESSDLMSSGISIKGLQPSEDQEPTRTGTCFPINVKLMGIEIPGQLIVVKVKEDKLLWIVWDNPYIYQIQRWESTPVKEGTRLTLKFDTEIPSGGILGNLVDALGFMGLADEPLKEVDMMLAAIQANFDPSLEPEELVSFGLRGEPYEAVLQAHEVKTWVNASPEKVEQWVIDAENAALYLKEFNMDEKFIRDFQKAHLGKVVYSEAGIHIGALRTNTDLFGVKRKKGRELVMRLYFLILGIVGYLELQSEPEGEGTLVISRIVFEIPTSGSAESMEVVLFAAGIQKRLRERVLMIKKGVEGLG